MSTITSLPAGSFQQCLLDHLPLLVADSTTQWLLLLKQSSVSSLSCFLPLASSHILFSYVGEYIFLHACTTTFKVHPRLL